MSYVVCWVWGFFFRKCIFSFVFSADDEQIAFSALCIGNFCLTRGDLLLRFMAVFS